MIVIVQACLLHSRLAPPDCCTKALRSPHPHQARIRCIDTTTAKALMCSRGCLAVRGCAPPSLGSTAGLPRTCSSIPTSLPLIRYPVCGDRVVAVGGRLCLPEAELACTIECRLNLPMSLLRLKQSSRAPIIHDEPDSTKSTMPSTTLRARCYWRAT